MTDTEYLKKFAFIAVWIVISSSISIGVIALLVYFWKPFLVISAIWFVIVAIYYVFLYLSANNK